MNKFLYDLSAPQSSIWLTEQFNANTSLNNIGGYVFIEDVINFDALEKAIKLYIKKNMALNLRIKLVNGEPKQYISDDVVNIDMVKLKDMADVKSFCDSLINTPFEFFDSSLYRIVMFKLPNGTGGFSPTLHHIISDAWNMGLLIDEIMEMYSKLLNGEKIDETDFPSYIDYINSEKEYFDSSRFEKDREFWNSMFDSTPELSYIAPDSQSESSSVAAREIFELDSDVQDKITVFCKENNCSMYTFFMAIYCIYIEKINNTHSPIIGTPVLNRGSFKEKHTSGMFVSTVPFKVDTGVAITFDAFLKQVASTQLSIFRHQKYPYDVLLADIKKEYGISDNLYDFVFSYQNARDNKNTSDVNYFSKWIFTGHTLDTLDVHFYDLDDTGKLHLYYDYQVDKLSKEDIYNMHARVMHIVDSVIKNPYALIADISVITPDEEIIFLGNFNTTAYDFSSINNLVSLFEDQVKKNLDKVACVFEDTSFTYAELNDKANAVAHFLLKDKSCKDSVVGILLPRSLNLFSCVWGVLKSGNGYLLIDPSLPKDRIEYMLKTANASKLITTEDTDIDFENVVLLKSILSGLTNSLVNPVLSNYNDSFCVIYTSGSTGTPKGVTLKKSGVLNMLYSYKHFLGTDDCDTFLSTSTVAFDMFIVESFVSLLSGKTVVLANDDERQVPVFMSNLIKKHNVDFILSTPSKIGLLLLNDDTKASLKDVKVIQLGGEVFKEHLYKELANVTCAKIFNGYGPSECTACCSNKEVTDAKDITIGKPFLNTDIFILNSDLNLMPIGYSGEICVAGLGVSSGYAGHPELTNKSFVKNPFGDGLIYKTGDMGKYLPDGNLVYLGRLDSQVKLRGLRIELDEITNKLLEIPGIVDAVCMVKTVNNISCICAYVVKSNDNADYENISSEDVKGALAKSLPYYMVPSHIVFLDKLPITLNGKVDTRSLPEILVENMQYVAPKTNTEIVLADLWSKILDIDNIGINANFFDLGGDSLCAIKLVSEVYSKLNVKISVKDIFAFPNIEALGKHIDSVVILKSESDKISKIEIADEYPLSSAQKRIYYTVQMEPDLVSYNTPGGLIFDKMPDIDKLESCLNILVNRHVALRTYFEVTADGVVQKVLSKASIKLDVVNSKDKEIDEIFEAFLKPFDLSKAPLFRVCLHILSNDKYMLLLDMHHIVCDGESIAIFVDELCRLYRDEILDDISLDYTDYAVWEQNRIISNVYKDSENYWVKQFEGEIPVLNMPTNYLRPSVQSFEGAKIFGVFKNSDKLFNLCKELNTTPYMFLLSAYYVLLYKYTNQTDIVVGSPIIARDNADLSDMIGMFVNTIALRNSIDANDSFRIFLGYVSSNCFNAFEHQTYPFDELLKKLNVARDTSRNPLFDTMFIYQNNGQPEFELGDLKAEYYVPDNHTSKFDFSLEVIPGKDSLDFSLEFCTKLFDKEFMSSFLFHYINILDSIIDDVDVSISDIDMLSDVERKQLLYDFNDTKMDYPCDKTIVDLFEEQVKLHPDNVAVVFEGQSLTYAQLNEKANRVANELISKDVVAGDVVGIYLNRNLDFIVSIFGVLKAGAVYMPMYTGYPIDRLNYMLEDSVAKCVITDSQFVVNIRVNTSKVLLCNLDNVSTDVPDVAISSENLAYVIYTSGSTGNPKGVKIAHKNLVNFVSAFDKYYGGVTLKDAFLASTNISFDVSIWEIFVPLLNGAKLVLNSEEIISDISLYCRNIVDNKISGLYIPPNILEVVYELLSKEPSVNISKLLVGVEPIKKSVLNKYFSLNKDLVVVNGYGPTETTICATALEYFNDSSEDGFVSIGKPLYNNKIYILDADFNLCPIGVAGELCIAGDGVGQGYLNNPTETSKLFVRNPFDNGMLYKSGDLAKWNSDGTLAFVGRIDNQIKLSGYRIELNEINSCIGGYDDISLAYTTLFNSNGKYFIVSYFTSECDVDTKLLTEFLRSKLPFYMIPKLLVRLPEFPLTPNGKIDVKSLPVPSFDSGNDFVAPESDFEKALCDILVELLGIDKISVMDNLFELGMDSLAAIKLAVKVLDVFYASVSVSDVFTHPTIRDLANYISLLTKTEKVSIVPAKKADFYPMSSAQKRIYYASIIDKSSVLYNIAGGIVLDKQLDLDVLQNCFNTLIARHDVLRTRFDFVGDNVVQIIEDTVNFTLHNKRYDTDNLDEICADFVQPFDLTKAPLFRAGAIYLPDGKMFLLLDMHHIISDGTSVGILLQELCDLYNGNLLSEYSVDYKDFSLWEKDQFDNNNFNVQKEFWLNEYSDDVPVLNMPTTYARPSVQSFEGSNYYVNLPKDIFENVNIVSKKLGVTPYMFMLSVFYVLLAKYSSQNDIVVGTPSVGREMPELSNMLGMFVNTIALRRKINFDSRFCDFVCSVRDYCLAAFQNQNYPFDELVKDLDLKRDITRNPLFDVMFIYQNTGYPNISFKDINTEYFVPDTSASKFDLSLEIVPVNDGARFRYEYCTKLFDEDFIERFSVHYNNILMKVLEDSNSKIADIDMLSEDERLQILYNFNDTNVEYPRDKTIVDLFEEQVNKTPDDIAVVFDDKSLSYRELNEKANQLARFLSDNNVIAGDVVCLLLDKSFESIISIWAVLKIGAAYLPIDVNYPNDRIDYIITDSQSKVLLTTTNYIHKSNDTIHALCIDIDSFIYEQDNVNNIVCTDISPDSLAYIMYTSGSTGKPKGVMVKHKNVVRLVKNSSFIKFGKTEKILQTGSIVFDACTFEIFGALLNGFELYVIKKDELLDAVLLQNYLAKYKITVLWLTAPLFNQLCEENPQMFASVDTLLTGGDVLSPKHINMVRAANPNLTVINGYGPTENTTFSCCFTVDKDYSKSIPIGKPISNSTAYVMSLAGNLAPVGVPGELWVGGDGVAKGYLNNSELTDEKFVENPFGDGLLYKTGDLVKWLPDGNIEFIGRIDSQVKIRGFRVELGEITSRISQFDSIKECATVVDDVDGEKCICAYIASDKKVNIQELKQYLKKFLPVYMIPTYFTQLEKLPINTNGKIDRSALPKSSKMANVKRTLRLPSTDNEEILLSIFKKLLSFDDISIDDDFFELGGDSLLAIKLQVEAVSNNLQLSYADIFDYPTVENLAKHIDSKEDSFVENGVDFEKYRPILEKNVATANMEIADTPIGNVLLTGFTGFLGAHVLDSFIKKESGIIYCLIRGKNDMSPEARLKSILHFYFDSKYDKYIGNRIRLVEGDITSKDFNLNIIDYNMLGTNVNTVIHCAALVKHYGSYKDFENINILGTKKVVDFCKAFNLRLLHVSTISVSGNNLAEGANIDNNFAEDVLFDETNFYIGQNLKNFYVRSKFEAERLVLDAISNGLQACILRMGNLTSRFSEGIFQQNHFENAFVNAIKSFIQIGCVPDYLLHTYCEFTPIDFCGDAIIDIANHMSKNYTVFHLLNEKHVYLDRLFEMMGEIGVDVNLVTKDEFEQIISTMLKDDDRRNDLDGIINKLDNDKKFVYKSDVIIKSDFTKEFLAKIGFEWPYIDTRYIRNYFKYLSDIGYFNLNIN